MKTKFKHFVIFFSAFLLSISLLTCSRYQYETSFLLRSDTTVTAKEEWDQIIHDFKKPPRIILVGFRGYKIDRSTTGIRTNEYFAVINDESSSANFFQNAFPIDNFLNQKGIPVDQKNAERVILEYLNVTEVSGKSEIEKLLIPSKKKFLLRETGADYILIGNHTPYYQERTKAAINSITGLFGILTFGIIPIYEESRAESAISVYDANLNYISTFYYNRPYTVRSALWLWPNEGFQTFFNQEITPPINAYKIHVDEFEREFLNQLLIEESKKKKVRK